MKKLFKQILCFALLFIITLLQLSCGNDTIIKPVTGAQVTEEEWLDAFSYATLSNVTISSTYDFPEESGNGCIEIENNLLFVHIIPDDGYEYAYCTNDDYFFKYEGSTSTWYKVSRNDYPTYEDSTTISKELAHFNMAYDYSKFTYNEKQYYYEAKNVVLLDQISFSSVKISFYNKQLYKIQFVFEEHTESNPCIQTLYFANYGSTTISMIIGGKEPD